MSTPKPQLKGLLASQIKRNLIVASVICAGLVTATYFLRNEPRKKDYAEFYKNYDADKAFKRMADAGLMQSVDERED